MKNWEEFNKGNMLTKTKWAITGTSCHQRDVSGPINRLLKLCITEPTDLHQKVIVNGGIEKSSSKRADGLEFLGDNLTFIDIEARGRLSRAVLNGY